MTTVSPSKARLPNFVFIGTGKTGTTWLFRQLAQNPQVFLTPVKETNFFDLNHQRGIDWYANFFQGVTTETCVGEISHRYINNAVTADRIAGALGPVKIIAALRKPDDFARSDHQFAVRNGRFTDDLNAFLSGPFEWDSIAYDQMLHPFFDRFGPDRVLVLDFADFATDPTSTLHQTERFLAVEPTALDRIDTGVVNGAASPRSRSLALAVNKAAKAIKRRGGQRVIQTVKQQDWVHRALYRPGGQQPWPIDPEHARRLDENGRRAARTIDGITGTGLHQSWYGEAS